MWYFLVAGSQATKFFWRSTVNSLWTVANGDIEGRAQLFGGYHAVAAEDHLFQNVQHAIDALRAFDGLLVGIHNHSCRLKVADTMRRWKKAAKRKRAAPVRDGV